MPRPRCRSRFKTFCADPSPESSAAFSPFSVFSFFLIALSFLVADAIGTWYPWLGFFPSSPSFAWARRTARICGVEEDQEGLADRAKPRQSPRPNRPRKRSRPRPRSPIETYRLSRRRGAETNPRRHNPPRLADPVTPAAKAAADPWSSRKPRKDPQGSARRRQRARARRERTEEARKAGGQGSQGSREGRQDCRRSPPRPRPSPPRPAEKAEKEAAKAKAKAEKDAAKQAKKGGGEEPPQAPPAPQAKPYVAPTPPAAPAATGTAACPHRSTPPAPAEPSRRPCAAFAA